MRILVCVAWPYADGPLHLGHLYGAYLPADIFARYHRMIGDEVLMVSGSDEHGTPITFVAEKEHVSPKDIADRYHEINKKIFEQLGISFDNYSRTSSENHKEVVKKFFLKLYEKGYIYPAKMISPYCPNCKRFLPDRYVEGTCPYCGYEHARGDQCDNCGRTLDPQELINPRCRICGSTPEFRETEHLFFRLSSFEENLKKWLEEKSYWRDNVKNFTYNFIKSGLKDRAVTRDIEWGIDVPIPGFENKKIYVWFEAVIGYLSSTIEYSKKVGKENLWEDYWLDKNTRHYYFIGKDNIPFHTIIWPAMLMGYGDLNLPYDVPANEYLNLEGKKFSKSSNIGIFLPEILSKYDPDMVRFYAALNLPEQHDSDFSWTDFYLKVNGELIDKFGNFVHRVLTFTKARVGKIPMLGEIDDDDFTAMNMIRETGEKMSEHFKNVELKKAIKEWLNLVYFGNQYFDRSAPWDLIKENEAKCWTKLHISLRIVKALAIYGYPFIPFTSQKIWNMLGYRDKIENYRWIEALAPIGETSLQEPKILFKKIYQEELKDWNRVDIRTIKIVEVKDHPNADKLYLLRVSLGNEERTLVAGLKKYYTPEDLLGKYALMVYNLEPAEIRGIVSQGMILAADDGNTVSILVPTEKVEGLRVLANNSESSADAPLSHKDFMKLNFEVVKLKVNDVVEAYGDKKYTIEFPLNKNHDGLLSILYIEKNKPYVLRTENGIITLDRPVNFNAKVK